MNRPFYSEYIRHALRFYARHLQANRFHSAADRDNWQACDEVLKSCSDMEKDILVFVYGSFDTLPDNVYNASKKYSVSQSMIWDLMKDVERNIAKLRGLL